MSKTATLKEPSTLTDEIKYQIFLSSTYEDLKEERSVLVQTILRSYNFPIGMEMFNANNKKSWDVIKANIDSSDIYILVVGHRYGTPTSGKNPVSFTEKEYDYACSRRRKGKLKILCFIRKRDYLLEPSKTEQKDEGKKNLEQFIDKVKSSNQIAWFTTPDNLGSFVNDAINKTIREFNNVNTLSGGWIKRGSDIEEKNSVTSPIAQSIPELKNFLRVSALEFEVTNSDRETYYFDETGNCEIETERSQYCHSDVTHSLNGYTNEKPGNFEILEVFELNPGSIITTPVILEQSSRLLSFCILYDKLAKRGTNVNYRFKVKVENFLSNLIENRVSEMYFTCLPKVSFSQKTDILIFPKKPIFDKLSVKLLQVYPNQIINEEIAPDDSDPKKRKFIINYGAINVNYYIIIELKLNK